MSIRFFDCPNCGKSLRVGARHCHHCHAVDENDWADPDAAPEFAEGGYSEEIDETAEYSEEEKPRAKWKRIAGTIIILLLILSFILQLFFPVFTF